MRIILIVSLMLFGAFLAPAIADAPATEPSTKPAAAIELTPAAIGEIRVIIAQQQMDPKRVYLRVGVKQQNGQFSYVLDLNDGEREAGDIDVRTGGMLVRVHKDAMAYLRGTTIDFKDRDGERGFVFHNPNAVDTTQK